MSGDPRKGECEGRRENCKVDGCPLFGTLGKPARDGQRRIKGCGDAVARGRRSRRKGLKKQRDARKALGVAPSHKFGDANEERWNDPIFANEVKSGKQIQPAVTAWLRIEKQVRSNEADFGSLRKPCYQFFVHTETVGKLWKPIEFVLNTPSHHRVHHSNNPRYLDANYAAVLIIWDRIFGTFVEEREEDVPKYGLVQNIGTFNLFFVAFHEWISIFKDVAKPGLTLRERLMYMFAAPGWSHDGSRKTSWDLKAQYVRKHPDQSGMPGLPDLVAKNDGSAGRVQPAE